MINNDDMKNAYWFLLLISFVFSELTVNAQNNTLHFDGVDDYVNLGADVGDGVRTIELWFKPDGSINSSLSNFQTLVNRDMGASNIEEFYLAFMPNSISGSEGKLRFNYLVTASNVHFIESNSNSWNANQWYHIAGVIHPVQGMMLFIDGVKQSDTENFTNATATTNDETTFGSWGDVSNRYFKGEIDDVRFSTTARYDADFTPPCIDLVSDGDTKALWNINTGSGTVIFDSSPNGYHALISGATWGTEINGTAVGGSVSSNATVCSGSNSGTLTLSGHSGSVKNWELSTDGGSNWSSISNTTTTQTYTNLNNTTQYRAVVQSGRCPAATSASATITVTPGSVGGTVSSNTAVCGVTNSGTLSLSGHSGTIVRWESSTDGGSNWSTIVNATTSQSYTNLAQTTLYRAVAQSGGCPEVYSSIAAINVNPISVGGVVTSDATVCGGSNSGTLSLAGYVGSILRWELSTDGGSNWSTISNTSTSQSYSNLSATTRFRAVVQSGSCTSANSSEAVITVVPGSVGGTVSSNTTVCGSGSGTLVLSGYTGSVIRWESSIDAGSNWNTIVNNSNTQPYNVSQTTLYRAVVQSGGCSLAYSSLASITVNPASVGGVVTSDATVCNLTNSGALNLVGHTGSVIRWESSTDGGTSWLTLPNTTASQSYLGLTTTTRYRAVVQSGVCSYANSSEAIITIDNACSTVGNVLHFDGIDDYVNLGSDVGDGIRTIEAWVKFDQPISSTSESDNVGIIHRHEGPTNLENFGFEIIPSGHQWAGEIAFSYKKGVGNYYWARSNTNTWNADQWYHLAGVIDSTQGVVLYVDGVKQDVSDPNYTSPTAATNDDIVIGKWGYLDIRHFKGEIDGVRFSTTARYDTNFTPSCTDVVTDGDTKALWNFNAGTGSIAFDSSPNGYHGNINGATWQLDDDNSVIAVGGVVNSDATVCGGANSGALVLSGHTGVVTGWELSTDGGTTWYPVSNTATTQSYTNLTITTKFRAVIQSGRCPIERSSEATITVTELTVGVSSSNATCSTNDGTATTIVSGGTLPYNYQWTNGDTTAISDSLSSGIYVVTVTDALGCSNFGVVTISDVEAPLITVNSVTNLLCNGDYSGAIDISVSGGNTPYTYMWSNGVSNEDISNLPAGPYEIIVSDVNNCVTGQSITVVEPEALTVSFGVNNADCGLTNGVATATITGGTNTYNYLWSTGSTDQTITGLAGGLYTLTVNDGNNCSVVGTVAVGENEAAVIIVDSITNLSCGGDNSVYVHTTGGQNPITFDWSNGDDTEDLLNVPAGNYTLTVTGGDGCASSKVIEIETANPDIQEICLITVADNSDNNVIVWTKEISSTIATYNIYRETSQSGFYQQIGSVPYDSLSQFVDTLSDPMVRSWRYKIVAADSCGNESDLSMEHKTMHLTTNLGLNNNVNLIWDHYEGFTFSTYVVHRYTQANGDEILTSIPSSLTSYTDLGAPVSDVELYYYVEVVSNNGSCTATKANDYNSARSNRTIRGKGVSNTISNNIGSTFKLYPNPNNGHFTVSGVNKNNSQLTIYDIQGKIVYQEIMTNSGEYSKNINLSNLQPGMYFAELVGKDFRSTEKVIIAK